MGDEDAEYKVRGVRVLAVGEFLHGSSAPGAARVFILGRDRDVGFVERLR